MPVEIRTQDLRLRRPTLYPAELRAHDWLIIYPDGSYKGRFGLLLNSELSLLAEFASGGDSKITVLLPEKTKD